MDMKHSALLIIAFLVLFGCVFGAGCTSVSIPETLSDEILSSIDSNMETLFDEDEPVFDSLDLATSSGSFSSDTLEFSYNATMENDVRTLCVTMDQKEYILASSPVRDYVCGDWVGEDGLTVTYEEDGCGSYSYPNDSNLQYFFWGKNDDGTYEVLLTDHTFRTLTRSGDNLTDSSGLVLKKQF